MIEVEVPGVGTVEFPDGTPPEQMKQALDRYRSKPVEQKSVGTRLWENIVGDNDPNTQNLGEKVGTFLNKAGESMTFGLVGDETGAAVESLLPGVDYETRRDHYRNQEALLEKTNPGTALTADLVGALLGAVTPAGAIGTLGRGAGMGARIAASGAAGVGMGGTYGFMEGEGLKDRLAQGKTGATIGGVVGIATPIIGAGVQKIADSITGKRFLNEAARNATTAAQQRAAAGRQYDAFEGAGAEISPDALSRLRAMITDKLQSEGLGNLPGAANLTPGGRQILNTVGQMDDQVRAAAASGKNPAVPLKSIEDLRRFAGDVAQDVNPIGRATRDARLGSIAVDEIDNFVNGLQAADVPIGDPAAAKAALTKARQLWATASKTQLLENVLDAQDNYLGGAASAIRNKVATLLRNPKTARQFTDAEKTVLRKIIGGNALARTIRLAGNGIGRQAQMALGAAGGGPIGAIAGALTGELSSKVANRNAVKAAELARNIIANGGIDKLPVATDSARRLVEALMRRTAAVAPQ